MNLLDLQNKSKSLKFVRSYLPKCLSDIIGDEKKIRYKDKNLKTAYLIDIIHTFITKNYILDKTLFNMDARILRERYGTFYNYYMDFLIDKGFISLFSNYCAGKKSKTYKISDIILKDVIIYKNTDTVLLKKKAKLFTISYLRKMNYKHISLDLMIKIVDHLSRVSIRYVDAKEYIDTLRLRKKQRNKNEYSILCLKDNTIWYSFDQYGRFHSNLTTLKSEIREKFLLIDEEPTMEIDITNSQPIFLTQLMSRHLDMVDIEEYKFFKQLVIKGKLYQYFAHNTDITEKKQIKKMMYTVFFGTNHLGKKENKYFIKLFPSIFNFIKKYKKENDNYKSLSYELQRSESNLLFNNVVREIVNTYPDLPFFTVHDSISMKESDYDKVKNIFDKNIKKIHEEL